MSKSKSIISLISLFAGLLALSSASIQAAELKVGFVNVSKILDQAPQAQSASLRIEKEFAPRDRDLVAQQKAMRAMEDRLVKNGAVMSATERERQSAEIRKLRREIRTNQGEFREDLNLARSREMTKLQRRVVKVIKDLAKAEKYDLIIGEGVIYAGEKVNITNKILAKLKANK
jgi:outer membrane protein